MAYGSLFGVSWTVTRNHLPYIPAGFGGALLCELLRRRAAGRFAFRLPGTAPLDAPPRRAR